MRMDDLPFIPVNLVLNVFCNLYGKHAIKLRFFCLRSYNVRSFVDIFQ